MRSSGRKMKPHGAKLGRGQFCRCCKSRKDQCWPARARQADRKEIKEQQES